MTNNTSSLLNIKKAAKFLGISTSTLRRWAQRGMIHGLKVGPREDWRFTEESLSTMIKKTESQKVAEIKVLLQKQADVIQKLATEHHRYFIADKTFRSEFIEKYQQNHIKVVKAVAENLDKDIQRSTSVFKKLGETLANDAVADGLKLDEAVDGIIFLKQAVWEVVEQSPVFSKLSRNDFYHMSQAIGTYCDVISTRIAFTYHRKIEESLKRTEERFQTLIEKSTDVIALSNNHGRYLYVTPSIQQVLGYAPEEFIQVNGFAIIHPDDLPHIQKQFKKLLNNPGKSATVELRGKHKNGSWRWIEASATNFFHEPSIQAIVSNFRDISDRKDLERQKEEFLGIASHELKTPVTSLKGYAQMLQKRFKRAGDEVSARYLSKMDSQLNKLTHLIGDLLDITKIDSGKLQFNLQHFNFAAMLHETVESIQQTSEKHHISITGTYDKNVYADRNRIGQVLTNLLTNAIKYSPLADKIITSVGNDNKNVTVCIQDFGIGISKENQKKVFERFYRETGPTEATYPGLGLGLYICREIIERHNGRIWVESRKGKGATFCFTLPIRASKHITHRKNIRVQKK